MNYMIVPRSNHKSKWYKVEPIGCGYDVEFQATDLEMACAKAHTIARGRMRRVDAPWRLYDENDKLQAEYNWHDGVTFPWA